VAAGVTSSWVRVRFGEPAARWTELFDLDGEANVPTWFSSVLLLRCAMMSARWRLPALAAVFAVLSLDEVAMIHERAAAALMEARVVWPWPWVIGAGLVVAALFVLVPSLRAMPAVTRRGAVVAGAVYVGGALGVEVVAQRWGAVHGWLNVGYVTLTAIEEGMEMLGAILYVEALRTSRSRSDDAYASSLSE
jgi:hypothetical protein